jgi:hypothetical protein
LYTIKDRIVYNRHFIHSLIILYTIGKLYTHAVTGPSASLPDATLSTVTLLVATVLVATVNITVLD